MNRFNKKFIHYRTAKSGRDIWKSRSAACGTYREPPPTIDRSNDQNTEKETEKRPAGWKSILGCAVGAVIGYEVAKSVFMWSDSWLPIRYSDIMRSRNNEVSTHKKNNQEYFKMPPNSSHPSGDNVISLDYFMKGGQSTTPTNERTSPDITDANNTISALEGMVRKVLPSIVHLEMSIPLIEPRKDSKESICNENTTLDKNTIIGRITISEKPSDSVMRLVSTGTGFVVHEDGIVLTAAHVLMDYMASASDFQSKVPTIKDDSMNVDRTSVEVRPTIKAIFEDGSEYSCSVYSVDIDSDIAFLRLEGGSSCGASSYLSTSSKHIFKPLTMAPMTSILPGDPVFTVGFSYGFPWSASSGILSYKHRLLRPSYGVSNKSFSANNSSSNDNYIDVYDDNRLSFSQVVMPGLSEGSSGGPLLNQYGQVVGLISFKATRSGSSDDTSQSLSTASCRDVTFALELEQMMIHLRLLAAHPHPMNQRI